MTARLLTTADAEAWNAALPPARSAFGSIGFARARERAAGVEPRLAVAGSGSARVAYPLDLRPLADLDLGAVLDSGRWDAASPPFTGPFVDGPGPADALRDELEGLFRDEGVVTEFAHLHPWASSRGLAPAAAPDREIVWVDLRLDPEDLWREAYSKACRKNVRRAEREGVTVRPARDLADVAAFHHIYIATMERNEAAGTYFLGLDYFEAIFKEMPDSARFALAEHEGEVIAATLYLHDADDVYSYLGGADHSHQRLRPTNAVVHQTIAWAREQGKRRLVLGGGHRPGDGIMRFKASFSPERVTLELARGVHLQRAYDALVAAWRARHPGAPEPGFFPPYRA